MSPDDPIPYQLTEKAERLDDPGPGFSLTREEWDALLALWTESLIVPLEPE